jgi:hypothetical protein
MKTYVFHGIATVSVTTEVEASSEEEARLLIEKHDCTWRCEDVDGDVDEIDLACVK